MSKVTNSNVVQCWGYSQEANSHTGNLWTDGNKLYSYRLCIGETLQDGKKLLHDYTSGGIEYYSQTTSCHVGRARRYADLIRTKTEIVENKRW